VGEIIRCSTTDNPDKVLVELLVSRDELRQLRGEMRDVAIFTDRILTEPSKVSLRGRNDSTHYFLIPRQLRRNLPPHCKVSCQRFGSHGKIFFVYGIDPAWQGRASIVGEL
jgi:hypothetical protein